MAVPNAQELLDIALINRARLDPAAEAALLGIDLNEGLAPGTISATSKQPLAFSDALGTAAVGHSQSMITNNYFAHTDPTNGSTPQSRATAAGYAGGAGENIAARGSTGALDLTTTVAQEHVDLFVDSGVAGRGHRTNMLSDSYQQIGAGAASGVTTFFGGTFNTVVLTEDYGVPSVAGQFITGITYNDTDANAFYSVGEGRAGMTVTTGGGPLTSIAAGGYSGAIGSGVQSLTYSGGGLATPIVLSATITAGRNALIDIVGQSTVVTSTSIAEVSGITTIIGLGTIGLALSGAGGDETIVGAKGGDTLNGGGGADSLSGGEGDDFLFIDHLDQINGGAGYDAVFVQDATGASLNVGAAQVEWIYAYTGNDTLNAATSTVGVALIGEAGADSLTGSAFADYIYFDALDTINAGAGYDALFYYQGTGQALANLNLNVAATNAEYVVGGGGNDTLFNTGSSTAVALIGGAGNDTLTGGLGNDYLYGDSGTGNIGNDVFVVTLGAQTDVALDFANGADRLNVHNTGFTTFAQVQAAASAFGAGSTQIDFGGGNKMVLYNFALGSLDATDIIF